MPTIIICPACETRYEIAAELPPKGRKVRCSKCGHTWQATGVTEEGRAETEVPQSPPPQPQAPQVAAVNAALSGFAGIVQGQHGATPNAPPTQEPAADTAGAEQTFQEDYPQEQETSFEAGYPEADAEFAAEAETDFETDYTEPEPEPAPGSESELKAEVAAETPFVASYSEAETAFETGVQDDVTFEVSAEVIAQADAEFEPGEDLAAGHLPESVGPAQGGDFVPPLPPEAPDLPPDLSVSMGDDAGPVSEDIPVSPLRKKVPSTVAIGWGGLGLLLLFVVGAFMLMPKTVVSAVPGTARLYAMLGMPVNLRGLSIEGVTYGWTDQGDLEIKGDVVNLTDGSVKIPLIVIALRDENGQSLSEWTTEVREEPLGAGERASFWTEIPAPPDTARSVKVRFAKAN
jgi:predicted Zn finger-like uncharacterized protein